MKKNGVLLLILFCCFQKATASFTPVTITSGFNADIVANGTGSASASATAFDIPNGYSFVSSDFQQVAGNNPPDYSLPSNGLINSIATSGLSFQFASYASNNALLLSESTTTGTLNVNTAGVGTLYFLVAAANGSADFTATIHFTDASSQTSNTLTANDWYGNPGNATNGIGRVALSSGDLDGDGSDPRLYQVALQIDPANYAKTISSITFNTNLSGGTSMAVMGISKEDVCNGTPSITTTNSTVSGICAGSDFTLSLSSTATDPGITFQWQTSPDNNIWTSVTGGGTNSTFTTTQTSATYYRCIVTCLGSNLATPSVSTLVGLNPANQCYCFPGYATGCSVGGTEFYDIDGVVINGENGTSIANTDTGCSASNAYTDYSTSVSPVSLMPYSDYTIHLYTQSTSVPIATAWIDLNNDAVFDDATERVGTTGTTPSTFLPIAAPSGTVGNHRLRITTAFLASAAITDPCGSYNSGETEDYTINLLPTPTCVHPLNLTTNTVNITDQSFSWTAGSAGTTYDYAVDQTPSADPDAASLITNISTNNATITAVTPGNTYYFHLRAHCSSSDSSIWIVKPFTLASVCGNAVSVNLGTAISASNASYAAVSIPATACGSTTDASYHGMWYKVTPTNSGVITFSTLSGTSFDSYLRVFSGNCGTLACQGFNDNYFGSGNNNQSFVSVNATANTTYYVLMTGKSPSDTGNFTFDVAAGPTNDEAISAISISPNAPCAGPYSNLGATASIGEPYPKCSGFSALNPVWFSFVAPPSGTARISTDYASGGTVADTRLGLYTATDATNYGTFTLISCDDDNGITGAGSLSTLYATNLTPGGTYYVEVDNGFTTSSQGTFCVTVNEITPAYLSTAPVICGNIQQPAGFNGTYTGWISLVDDNDNLVALVRNPGGSAPASFSGSYTVNTSGIRQDVNGVYYLDRNYFISNPSITTPVDVQFFFSPGEFGYINGISQGAVTMSDLNVTKQEGSNCEANYSQGLGTVSVLLQSGNQYVNGVGSIQVSTSSFSNFYLMGGTAPLAVKLLSIDAVNQGSSNKISWTTATENPGDYFELERSADGKNFSFLAKIVAHQKPSGYVYNDDNPLANVNYYRLKMISADGSSNYSKVVQAKVSEDIKTGLAVFPNPAAKQITLKVYGTANGQVTLTDISGRILYSAAMDGSEMNIDMSSFINGFYLIHYVDGNLNKVVKINKR